MAGRWGGRLISDLLWEILDDFIYILDHHYFHALVAGVIQIHSQVLMYLATGHRHLASVELSQRHDELSHFHRILVADLQIINMPTYGHLGSVNILLATQGL